MTNTITLPREVVERLIATWDWDAETLIGHRMKTMSDLIDDLRTALAAPPPEDIEALRGMRSGGGGIVPTSQST